VRDLAKGSPAQRREILGYKLGKVEPELSSNKYIERGNIREPVIAQYILDNFDIEPSDTVYHHGEFDTHLATPDGLSSMFDMDRITSEIKTSKHNLDPDLPGGHFATTGYYDQVQWQMHVMGGDRCLFVWEQHDDNWPNPEPVSAPQFKWISRDQARIDQLVDIAEEALAEVATQRAKGGEQAEVARMDSRLEELTSTILEARAEEGAAKKKREAAWKEAISLVELQGIELAESDTAKLSYTTTTKPVDTPDMEAMLKRAPKLVEQYNNLVTRCMKRETKTITTFTVNALKKDK
jgi:hypothetical protein